MNLFVSLLFVEMLTREVFHNKITFQAGATGPVLTDHSKSGGGGSAVFVMVIEEAKYTNSVKYFIKLM